MMKIEIDYLLWAQRTIMQSTKYLPRWNLSFEPGKVTTQGLYELAKNQTIIQKLSRIKFTVFLQLHPEYGT